MHVVADDAAQSVLSSSLLQAVILHKLVLEDSWSDTVVKLCTVCYSCVLACSPVDPYTPGDLTTSQQQRGPAPFLSDSTGQ